MNEIDRVLEQVLVLKCQTGDSRALEELYLRHSARLGYYLRRLLDGDEAAAADVQQETWLTVVRKIKRLRATEAFAVWLYRVARSRALDRLARKGERVALESELPAGTFDAAEEPEPTFSVSDAAAIHAAMDQLRRGHRDVLLLRFMEDLSYEQIAEVTGCNVGTVRSRLFYAKQALRRELEKQR